MRGQEKITCVNPSMLKWARLSSGIIDLVSLERMLGKVLDWEAGTDFPTYSELEKLSDIYRKPIAVFFFPKPPEGYDISVSFRTLTEASLSALSYKVIRLINEAQVMQLNVIELSEQQPASEFLHSLAEVSFEECISQARQLLGVSIKKQLSTKKCNDMFEVWRDALFEKGIFVFKDAFHDRSISGFSLFDNKCPVIYVNNSMSFTRQIFTLFHELFHLVNETNGIDKVFDSEDDYEGLTEKQAYIERTCNRFAAQFLVPTDALLEHISGRTLTYSYICELSDSFCVSRESLIIRLIYLKKLTWDFYNSNIEEIQNDFYRIAPKSGGGNSNNTLVSYLGKKYLNLAFRAYKAKRIDAFQLATYTRTSVSRLQAIENAWGWKQ